MKIERVAIGSPLEPAWIAPPESAPPRGIPPVKEPARLPDRLPPDSGRDPIGRLDRWAAGAEALVAEARSVPSGQERQEEPGRARRESHTHSTPHPSETLLGSRPSLAELRRAAKAYGQAASGLEAAEGTLLKEGGLLDQAREASELPPWSLEELQDKLAALRTEIQAARQREIEAAKAAPVSLLA